VPYSAVILSQRARVWRASRKPALSGVEGDLYSHDVAQVGVLRLVRAKLALSKSKGRPARTEEMVGGTLRPPLD